MLHSPRLLAVVSITFTTILQAQSTRPSVAVPGAVGQFFPTPKPPVSLNAAPERRIDSVAVARDHRWAGGAFGAIIVGALGYRYARATCNGDSGSRSCAGHNLSRIAMGILVGGVAGLFIGSSIPKQNPDSTQ